MTMRLVKAIMATMMNVVLCLRSILPFSASSGFSPLRLLAVLSLTAVSLSLTLYPTASYAVFTTPSQFSVGGDGAATYNIPIQVPPGTAGMTPKLSLTYSSSGSNGILGMGWGIDGLSQISRCPTTLVQDGKITGVNYTATDRFCIDGQRLIATTDSYVNNPNDATKKIYTSTAAYGANLTEYKTELANFAKIISYGTAGNGPAYFKVWTKGGQIIEYGNTADSRIEAAGIATARTWGVNKISDTKGNYITITYIEDNPNGEAYVSRIDYTGNANSTPVLSPYASVQFVYETRTDTTTNYVAGLVIKSTKRMTNVRTYNGSTLVKDYRLTYTNNGTNHFNTSNVADGSLLTKLQECDGAATPVCQNPTNLTWTIAAVNTNTFGAAQSWGTGTILATGDVNGDGRADIIFQSGSPSLTVPYATLSLGISTGSGFTIVPSVATQTVACIGTTGIGGCSAYAAPQVQLGDINGDGRADLINGANVSLSTGSGFGAAQSWGVTKVLAVSDVNGDGRADIIFQSGSPSLTVPYATLSLGISTGSGFTIVPSVATQTVACIGTTGIGGCSAYAAPQVQLGDINGDGRADLINGANVSLSTGSGFGAAQSWGVTKVLAVSDVNGDGRADIIFQSGSPSLTVPYATLSLGISTGSGFTIVPSVATQTVACIGTTGIGGCSAYAAPQVQLGDANGDGLSDLLNKTTLSPTLTSAPDQLTTIANGLGAVTTISYKKLSDPTVYTPETGAAYPVRDILPVVPLYVVSSYTQSDGTGGVVTTNYNYGGLKAELTGRGSLGFRYVKESSPDSNIALTTFYKQDYPYIGLPLQTEKRILSSNLLIGASQLTYANTDLTSGSMISKFPYLSQSVEQAFELDGTLVNTTTSTNQYDAYGNVTQVSVDSGDGYIKTTANVYNNDTTNWFLGRLLRSTVTSTTP